MACLLTTATEAADGLVTSAYHLVWRFLRQYKVCMSTQRWSIVDQHHQQGYSAQIHECHSAGSAHIYRWPSCRTCALHIQSLDTKIAVWMPLLALVAAGQSLNIAISRGTALESMACLLMTAPKSVDGLSTTDSYPVLHLWTERYTSAYQHLRR